MAAPDPPLSTLLSQALVAFTIELDNEFEHRTPHWTSNHGGTREGPWLASMVMYLNCMRYVTEEGITVRELRRLARTGTNLDGMRRWGYLTIEPGPAAGRPKPRPDSILRATRKGLHAREMWRPLFGEIEDRWKTRFGAAEVGALRESLWALIGRYDLELPDCLPILGYGLFSRGRDPERPAPADPADQHLPLPSLLSRALLALALEFERESDVSLAICANIVRVLDEKGVRVRDLPQLSGVSKEAIAMGFGILRKKRLAAIVPDPAGGRSRMARLTPAGQTAKETYRRLLAAIQKDWQARFGGETIGALQNQLQQFSGEPLFRGLDPYSDGWRASFPRPATLPHYPMVLHRGGYPDGS